MRIVALGTGTGAVVKDRGYAGVYIRVAGEHVLCDAGPGTLRQLARAGVTYLDLDRIFITHFHPDHSLDLVSILFAMRIPSPARTRPLAIYGPKGLRRLITRLNAAFQGWLTPRSYRLTIRELDVACLRLPGYTVRTGRMHHSTRALGYRIEAAGRSVVYSGDTDVCDDIIRLGRGADLLMLECSMTDERKVTGHLTPSECGHIAAAARCRRLVLTHFYPVFAGYDIRGRVRRHFSGPVILARDLQPLRV